MLRIRERLPLRRILLPHFRSMSSVRITATFVRSYRTKIHFSAWWHDDETAPLTSPSALSRHATLEVNKNSLIPPHRLLTKNISFCSSYRRSDIFLHMQWCGAAILFFPSSSHKNLICWAATLSAATVWSPTLEHTRK